MQTGQFILHRQMVDIIREICMRRGIEFTSLSNDWLLELKKDGRTRRIVGYKFSLNDSVASAVASDKVAAHLLLQRADLPSVEHILLRPPVADEQKNLLSRWSDLVVKPLDGSGGYGVKLFHDVETAVSWIESTDHPAWAAAPFVAIAREIRLMLLDGELLVAYEKQAVTIDGLKMFNLGLGATPSNIEPDENLLDIARKAQSALGLRLSAVDIVETTQGERMILEVNSGLMMENYLRSSEENKQLAVSAYEKIIAAVMDTPSQTDGEIVV
jgi:glutathione synthase/RimK-type ligase-like ATP-grasp enzyme